MKAYPLKFSGNEAQRELDRLGAIAQGIINHKGSYEPTPRQIDPRLAREYAEFYEFVRQIADEHCPKDGRVVDGQVMRNRLPPQMLEQPAAADDSQEKK